MTQYVFSYMTHSFCCYFNPQGNTNNWFVLTLTFTYRNLFRNMFFFYFIYSVTAYYRFELYMVKKLEPRQIIVACMIYVTVCYSLFKLELIFTNFNKLLYTSSKQHFETQIKNTDVEFRNKLVFENSKWSMNYNSIWNNC